MMYLSPLKLIWPQQKVYTMIKGDGNPDDHYVLNERSK